MTWRLNLDPQPAGFCRCFSCAYRETGTPAICYLCTSRAVQQLDQNGCDICGLSLNRDGECPNYVCRWPDRFFDRNYAIAVRTGDIEQAINAYKYRGLRNWAFVFGRVLVGYLNEFASEFQKFDLIISSPTHISQHGNVRRWDHIQLIIDYAATVSQNRWPFATNVAAIVKTRPTTPMVGKSWRERRAIAENEIRQSLEIPNTSVTDAKSILVFDDVFTDGFTLREVARCLLLSGAARAVSGITLVRQPWTDRARPGELSQPIPSIW